MGNTSAETLSREWKRHLVGQDHAIEKIAPYVIRAQAELNAPNRPAGVFFLMGPTGTGKTRTAETLAAVLHDDERNIIRVDCGEFQMEHEVAKLMGSPPGYLGHRETQPIFTQAKINAVATDKCNISIILFDEIEKAHPGVWRAILNILDKATLKLGDNTTVNFERCLIFLSSNVGAKEISDLLEPHFGFSADSPTPTKSQHREIEKVGKGVMSRKFPPEFSNRVDEIITYDTLTPEVLKQITALELKKIQKHIGTKLGNSAFVFSYEDDTVQYLCTEGTSIKYGARELKRAINRHVLNPLADDYLSGKISSGSVVCSKVVKNCLMWVIQPPSSIHYEPDEQESSIEVTAGSSTLKRTRRAKGSS